MPAACTAALRCVPFVLPQQWTESPAQMAQELAMYSIHAHPPVRQAGTRSRRTLPACQPGAVLALAPLLDGTWPCTSLQT